MQNPAKSQENSNFQKVPYSFTGKFNKDPSESPYRFNILQNIQVIEGLNDEARIEEVSQNWDKYNPQYPESVNVKENVTYWLKAQIKGNQQLRKHILQIAPELGNDLVNFNIINAYHFDKNGKWVHQVTGLDIPSKDRVFKFWIPLIEVDVPANDTIELYVQVKMDQKDKRFLPEQLGINHIDESSIWPNQIYFGIAQSVFYAILIFQFFYVLLLYLMEREKMQLYLTFLMIGSFLAIAFTLDNYREFVILSTWRSYHDNLSFLRIFLIMLGQLKFTQHYFNYPNQSFFVQKVIPCVVGIGGTLIIISSFTRDITQKNPLPFILLIVAWGLSFYMAITSKQKASFIKRLYFVAFLPPILVLCVMLFYSFNLNLFHIENYNRTFDFLNKGILITMSALALSAGYRSRKIKEEKEEELKRNLKAEQEINKAINKFVPNEFISALGKKGITDVQLEDHTEREVTVLFSDIRGYTSLSEKLSPTENFKFVSNYSAQMGPIIRSNGGFINQYLGDGIMALFIDNPEGALKAAIEMHQINNQNNNQRMHEGNPDLTIGIGIHTGPLIMGVLGDEDRFDAATISDTVNAAARVEGLTKQYGCNILLSDASIRKVNESQFGLRYLEPVQVKGKKQVIKIYECFDGDKPALLDLKTKSLLSFKEASIAYLNKDFEKAINLFEDIPKRNLEDHTAHLFLKKSETFLKAGVPKNWEGVESMTFK